MEIRFGNGMLRQWDAALGCGNGTITGCILFCSIAALFCTCSCYVEATVEAGFALVCIVALRRRKLHSRSRRTSQRCELLLSIRTTSRRVPFAQLETNCSRRNSQDIRHLFIRSTSPNQLPFKCQSSAKYPLRMWFTHFLPNSAFGMRSLFVHFLTTLLISANALPQYFLHKSYVHFGRLPFYTCTPAPV